VPSTPGTGHMNATHTCFARVLRVTLLWRFSVISSEEKRRRAKSVETLSLSTGNDRKFRESKRV
jgi:hypothetical protein